MEELRPPRGDAVKKVFIVPYCHPDWAWTFTRRWHEKRYVMIIGEVLDLMRDHPGFRWYLDTYATQVEPFLRLRPGRVAELRRRVREGRIGVCGTFTNLRPTMVGCETQVRDILIGREKYRRLFPGVDLSVYAGTVDVSMGHPQMPQLLAQAGYSRFRFWRPHAALSAKGIPLEFFWEGLDGTRVLASRGSYGGLCFDSDLAEQIDKELSYNAGLSPTGVRWLSQGTDDCRPLRTLYTDVELPFFAAMKAWNEAGRPPIAFASPAEYFAALEKAAGEIPVVRGPLDPCEVCYNVGWGGSGGLFALRQENELNLTGMETWSALAALAGARVRTPDPGPLWEEHLLSCAHATQWLFSDDFAAIAERARRTAAESRRATLSALSAIVARAALPASADAVLFNRLPSERTVAVPLTVSFEKGAAAFRLLDGAGRPVVFQTHDRNEGQGGGVWEHFVTARVRVPAGGYTTLSAVPGTPAVRRPTRPALAVRWDGPEIAGVAAAGRSYAGGFGLLRFNRVDTTAGALHCGPVTGAEPAVWTASEEKEDGPLFSRRVAVGTVAGHPVIRETLVHRGEPRIEFRVTADWRGDDGFLTLEWPEVPGGRIVGDIPFGVEEKNLAAEPYGSDTPSRIWDNIERQREGLFYARSFVSSSDGKTGCSFIGGDGTRYHRKTGPTLAAVLLNTVTHRPGWERFLNESPAAVGRHRFTVHFVFHRGDWRSAGIPALAAGLLTPVENIPAGAAAAARRPSLPPARSFLSLSPAGLLMTSCRAVGGWMEVRFFETLGRRTEAVLTLDRPVRAVEKVALSGEVLARPKPGRTVRLPVRAREIVTLRLK